MWFRDFWDTLTHRVFSPQPSKPSSLGAACPPRTRSWRWKARWSWSSAARCSRTTPWASCSDGCSSTSAARTRWSAPAARSSTSSRERCAPPAPSSCPVCSRGSRKTCTSPPPRANGNTTNAEVRHPQTKSTAAPVKAVIMAFHCRFGKLSSALWFALWRSVSI